MEMQPMETQLLSRILATLPAALRTAEVIFGGGNGEKKRAAALEVLAAAIDLGQAVTNRHLVDAERFTAGLGTLIDGAVECLNAAGWTGE